MLQDNKIRALKYQGKKFPNELAAFVSRIICCRKIIMLNLVSCDEIIPYPLK